MSRFFSQKHKNLIPYTPGEQPRDMQYIKLNTNESPFPPSPAVVAAVAVESERLQLYSDPTCDALVKATAARFGVGEDMVVFGNGSDEILNFAFMAFADQNRPLVFPDITYGFYPVFADLNGIPYTAIPLKEDFTIDPADYTKPGNTVVIANPNAPTGLSLPLSAIETILAADPNRVVIVDEAYVDFGGESAVPLVHTYDNLLVVQTFSKSRSMAGARLGFAIGSPALIQDLNTIRYSTNPYNVNRMTMAAGAAALADDAYYMQNARTIAETRQWTAAQLEALGFSALPSKANFVFATHPAMGGQALYLALKERGILVRHFNKERLHPYVRITIGTMEQMQTFIDTVKTILEEQV